MRIEVPLHGGFILIALPDVQDINPAVVANTLAGLSLAMGHVRDAFARASAAELPHDTKRRIDAVAVIADIERQLNEA